MIRIVPELSHELFRLHLMFEKALRQKAFKAENFLRHLKLLKVDANFRHKSIMRV